MKRVALLIATGLLSQVACSAEMVIGSIDLQQLSPYITKMQQKAMKADSIKAEYATVQQHIAAMKQKATTDQSKMTADQKKAFAAELNTMKQQLSKETMAVSGKMIKAQNDAMGQVQDAILKQVADIAKARHVTTVFPKQALLYTENAVDLTADLKKKLDQNK